MRGKQFLLASFLLLNSGQLFAKPGNYNVHDINAMLDSNYWASKARILDPELANQKVKFKPQSYFRHEFNSEVRGHLLKEIRSLSNDQYLRGELNWPRANIKTVNPYGLGFDLIKLQSHAMDFYDGKEGLRPINEVNGVKLEYFHEPQLKQHGFLMYEQPNLKEATLKTKIAWKTQSNRTYPFSLKLHLTRTPDSEVGGFAIEYIGKQIVRPYTRFQMPWQPPGIANLKEPVEARIVERMTTIAVEPRLINPKKMTKAPFPYGQRPRVVNLIIKLLKNRALRNLPRL